MGKIDENSEKQMQNRRKYRSKTSKFTGVCYNNKNKKWQAAIHVQKKYVHLGLHDTEEQAAQAFDLKKLEINGLQAKKINFEESRQVYEERIKMQTVALGDRLLAAANVGQAGAQPINTINNDQTIVKPASGLKITQVLDQLNAQTQAHEQALRNNTQNALQHSATANPKLGALSMSGSGHVLPIIQTHSCSPKHMVSATVTNNSSVQSQSSKVLPLPSVNVMRRITENQIMSEQSYVTMQDLEHRPTADWRLDHTQMQKAPLATMPSDLRATYSTPEPGGIPLPSTNVSPKPVSIAQATDSAVQDSNFGSQLIKCLQVEAERNPMLNSVQFVKHIGKIILGHKEEEEGLQTGGGSDASNMTSYTMGMATIPQATQSRATTQITQPMEGIERFQTQQMFNARTVM